MPPGTRTVFVAVLGWALVVGAIGTSAAIPREDPEEEVKRAEELALAIRRNRVNELDAMLADRPALVNARIPDAGSEMAPLHLAAKLKSVEAVRCLLAHGAKSDLFVATALGDLGEVKRFARADPKSINALYGNQTPLGVAIHREYADVVKYLLEQGATVEYRDEDGELASSFYQAAVQSRDDIFDLVLAAAEDIDPAYIHTVVRRKHTSRLEKLIRRGVNLDTPDSLAGNTPLHEAALRGNTKAVELLLRAKCSHYLVNDYGLTPLQYCLIGFELGIRPSTEERLAVARLLVRHGVDVDLFSAIAMGDLARVREGLKRDPWAVLPVNTIGLSPKMQALVRFHWAVTEYPVMLRQSGCSSALYFAAVFGQAEVVEILLEKGSPVGAHGPRTCADRILSPTVNRDLGTALHAAASFGHATVVALLLGAGADPDALDDEHQTPLHRAAAQGHAAAVKLLLAAGCGRYRVDKSGATALSHAVQSGDRETVKALLDAKMPADLRDGRGVDPLATACASGDLGVFRLLYERRTPLGPDQMVTCLFDATAWNRPLIVEYLVKQGAVLDSRARKIRPGWTALHHAAASDAVNAGEMLLKLGSKPDVTDDLGQTPLHVAAALGQDRFVIVLLLKGARADARDKDGKTPYEHARAGKRSTITWLLRIAG